MRPFRSTAALALLAGAIACGHSAPPGGPPPARVEGQTVEIAPSSPQLAHLAVEDVVPRGAGVFHLTGRLAWDDDVSVRVYAPVAGRVLRVTRAPGEGVKVGDPLAVIDSPDFAEAQSDAKKAAGDLALATRTLDRVRDLYQHGAAARKDLDAAEDDHVRAVSEDARARAKLALYGARGGSVDAVFSLRSPIVGTLVERNVAPGQEVRPDQMLASETSVLQPLFVVTDPSQLWVWVDVPEVSLADLRSGQKIELHSSAYPGRSFEGQIDFIAAALDPATRTARVRGTVPNADGLLKAEMYVSVDVAAGDEPVGVEVPAKAVFLDGDSRYVFVEAAPGRFQRQRVAVGAERSGHVAVTGGLAAGQRVVTDGSLLLQQILDSHSGA
jgi:cobalt-zinc-cadmium efflux system membrane fusion protein